MLRVVGAFLLGILLMVLVGVATGLPTIEHCVQFSTIAQEDTHWAVFALSDGWTVRDTYLVRDTSILCLHRPLLPLFKSVW